MPATDDYLVAIDDAYWGEVYGIALYGEIAAARTDPRERAVWETLTELEVVMEARLRPLFERLGGDPAATTEVGTEIETGIETVAESHRRRGRIDGATFGALDWTALMEQLSRHLDVDIAAYRAIEGICPPDDAAVCRHLTQHEEVAKAFAEAELAGRTDTSIDPAAALIDELRAS